MNYHVREWLNPEGILASSSISVFHGKASYMEKDELIEYNETNLNIHDCHNAVRFHVINKDMKDYIKKMRLVAKVCTEFADHLEKDCNVNTDNH